MLDIWLTDTCSHPIMCNLQFVVLIPVLSIGVLNCFLKLNLQASAVSLSLFIHCFFDQFKAQRNPTPITPKLTCHKLLLLLAYQVCCDYSGILLHGKLNPEYIALFAI